MQVDWSTLVPDMTPRPQQIELLDAIAASPARVIMVEAPPGAGKSFIEYAYAKYIEKQGGSTYLVTPQRALQDALGKLPDVAVMKGARHYRCERYDDDPSSHRPHPNCPIMRAVEAAKSANVVAHNYASLLWQGRLWEPRSFLCLDEGHRAPEAVSGFMEVTFSYTDLTYMGLTGDSLTVENLLNAIKTPKRKLPPAVEDARDRMERYSWIYGLEDAPPAAFADNEPDLEALQVTCSRPLNFGIERDSYGIRLVPLRLSPLGSLLTRLGVDKVLILSATILAEDMMARELGLNPQDVEFLRVSSTFPVSNRPIVRRYAGKMSNQHRQATFPRLIAKLTEDMQRHAGEAGIVHTVSHELASKVVGAIKGELNDRLILLPQGAGRDECIERFLTGDFGKNAILIGPGLHEGFDGAGDAARWQAIIKAPTPYYGSARYQAMLRANEAAARRWYAWKEAQTFVQMTGRVVRSEDDYGVTYLYDSCLQKTLDSKFVPDYIRDALV